MNKKIDLLDLDIPHTDIQCWDLYPKHRWVYDLSRLLDAQNIKWSLYKTQDLDKLTINLTLQDTKPHFIHSGFIYTKETEGTRLTTEVYISKGDIKYMRHVGIDTPLNGEIELRISAFVILHFQKFTGVISVKTINNEIHGISLKPTSELSIESNAEVIKLIKKLYKKNDVIQVNGLTDQVHHETLTS